MLLLVVDAELDQLGDRWIALRNARLEDCIERGIDMPPVAHHLLERRTRQEPALGSRLPGAGGLVVGIEAIGEALIQRAEARKMRLQHERLEEPGGVRQVPLGGAGVVHRLDDLIFRTQRLCQRQGEPARLRQTPRQR